MLIVVVFVNHPGAVNAQPFLDAVVEWAWLVEMRRRGAVLRVRIEAERRSA